MLHGQNYKSYSFLDFCISFCSLSYDLSQINCKMLENISQSFNSELVSRKEHTITHEKFLYTPIYLELAPTAPHLLQLLLIAIIAIFMRKHTFMQHSCFFIVSPYSWDNYYYTMHCFVHVS